VNFVYVERAFRDCVSYHRAARHLLLGPRQIGSNGPLLRNSG